MIYKLGNFVPKIGENNFIAPNATIIGDVELGRDVTVLFGAVIRADHFKVKIGDSSNVQENVTIHGDENIPVTIGDRVTIGHNCVIHGCTIGDESVIGMGSVILNESVIPNNCLVAAGSVVTPKLKASEGDLIAGAPARVVRKLSAENTEYLKFAYREYTKDISMFLTDLEEVKINK